jgi:hypothetical protein
LLNERDTANDHCPHKLCDSTGAAAVSSNKVWLPVNTASWIVAGVAGLGIASYAVFAWTNGSTRVGVAPTSGGADVRLRMVF